MWGVFPVVPAFTRLWTVCVSTRAVELSRDLAGMAMELVVAVDVLSGGL
jgi:hypothetical protein